MVVDHRTGKPLAGVALTVKVERKDAGHAAGRTTRGPSCHQASHARCQTTWRSARVRLGLAPMTGFIRHRSFQAGDIPASYTLAMHPVETLSGVVRDEQGRPVEGVLVEPMTWMRSGGGGTDREEFRSPGRPSGPTPPWPLEVCRQAWRVLTRVGSRSGFLTPITNPSNYRTGKARELIKSKAVATVLPRGLAAAGRADGHSGQANHAAPSPFDVGANRFGQVDHPQQPPQTPMVASSFTHIPTGETIPDGAGRWARRRTSAQDCCWCRAWAIADRTRLDTGSTNPGQSGR